MKARVFLITLFAPFVLYQLASVAAFMTWNLNEEHTKTVEGLELAVILEDTVSSADVLSARVAEITGNSVRISSAKEQLEQFNSKFGVDVMVVLSENPFGPVVFSPLDMDTDPVAAKFSVSQLSGVRSAVYPQTRRNEIDVEFRDSYLKMLIIDAIVVLLILLQTWMAVRLEGAANEHVMSVSSAPYKTKRRTFRRRAFIKGALVGVFAAVAFLGLMVALDMNKEVSFILGSDEFLAIAAVTVIVSSVLTYMAELIAFPTTYKNSR